MPTAITAFVVAVGGWGAATALVLSVVSVGYAMVAMKNMATGSQQERKQILRSSAAPCNVIYGKNRSSGTLAFAEEAFIWSVDAQGTPVKTDDEALYMTVTHAGHPLHRVEDYLLNEEPLSAFSNKVEITTFKDGLTECDAELLQACPGWSADMIGKGFAWYKARLVFDQDLFPSGPPNINALKWGWEIEDPRTGVVGWSDNPAVCILHYLRHYLKYGDDELILETFINAANVCDEWVQLPGDAGQETRYRIGAEFTVEETPANVLEKMLATCGGEWVRVGGRLGLTVAAYYGPAVIEITEDELIDGIELQPEVERQDAINTVRGRFNSAEHGYVETDYPQVTVDEYVTLDGEEIIKDLNLSFVQSPWQCQRLAHIAIQRNRYGMQVRLPCNLRGFTACPGTIIRLSLAGLGLTGEFRVLDWEFSLDNGVVLVARRETAAMYDDAVGQPMDIPPLLSGNGEVAAPDNLRFETDLNQGAINGVLRWQNKAGQLAHTLIRVLKADVLVQTMQIPSPGESVNLVGLGVGSYTIEAIAVSVSGLRSPVANLAMTLAEPEPPTHADVDASSDGLTVMPHIGDDTGLSINTYFEFFFHTENDLAAATRLGEGKMLTKQGLAPDTEYFIWIYTRTPLGRSDRPLGIIARTSLISSDLIEHIDSQVADQVKQATEGLLAEVGSLTDIRSIAEDLDAQILAEKLAQGLSEIEAVEATKRVARLMQSVKTLSDDQQSLVQQVVSLYASFDEQKALVQTKDRAMVGYALKADGTIGQATSPAEAEILGETWIPGRALADSVKLVGIVTNDGRTLTLSQYFSAVETATGELQARAFLGIDADGRVTGVGITSEETGDTVFQAINLIADAVSISSPDNPGDSLMYYDTKKRQLVVKGRIILGDGFEVASQDDIQAQDGGVWETRYKLASSVPDRPSGRFPTGWGTGMPNPTGSNAVWAATAFINADDTIGVDWSVPGRLSGQDGSAGSWVDYRFKRSASAPSAPTGSNPSGWPDAPPAGSDPLWMSKVARSGSGELAGDWSAPARLDGKDGDPGQDGKGVEVQWSADGSSWHTAYQFGDKWMRQRLVGGTWSAAIKVVGEDGKPGSNGHNGAGFYRLVNSTGAWPGDGAANGLFKTAFGRYPVADDVLTFFKKDGKASTTRRCTAANSGDDAAWAAAVLLLHGDMIALGSISGDRIIANTEISAPFIKGGRIEIGGDGGTFAVDTNGAVTMRSAGNKARMELVNDRLQVYDDNNQVVVRVGRLS